MCYSNQLAHSGKFTQGIFLLFRLRHLIVHCIAVSQLRSGICCRISVCRLSVTFVRHTQAIEIFGNVSTAFGTQTTVDYSQNFMEIVPAETLHRWWGWELNARGVAKISDV